MNQDAAASAVRAETLQSPSYKLAFADILAGARDHRRWSQYAVFTMKRNYWRTRLGLFWPAISFLLFIVMMSLLWSYIFNRDLRVYMPHFGYGIACWAFMSAMIANGQQVFVANAGIIREFPLPLSFYAFAKTAKEYMIFLISLLCLIGIDIFYLHALDLKSLIAIPALCLFFVTGFLASLIMGMLTTRFRDIAQIIPTAMRGLFFFTPVLWTYEGRPALQGFVLWNPFYHAIELVRAPMTGQYPSFLNWAVVIGCALMLLLIVLIFFKLGTRQLRVWL